MSARRVRKWVRVGIALLAVLDGPGRVFGDGYRAHRLPDPPPAENVPEPSPDPPAPEVRPWILSGIRPDPVRHSSGRAVTDDPVVASIRDLPSPRLSLDSRRALAGIEEPAPSYPGAGRNLAHTIPEPPSILLLLAGLSIFGIAVRRRLLRARDS